MKEEKMITQKEKELMEKYTQVCHVGNNKYIGVFYSDHENFNIVLCKETDKKTAQSFCEKFSVSLYRVLKSEGK